MLEQDFLDNIINVNWPSGGLAAFWSWDTGPVASGTVDCQLGTVLPVVQSTVSFTHSDPPTFNVPGFSPGEYTVNLNPSSSGSLTFSAGVYAQGASFDITQSFSGGIITLPIIRSIDVRALECGPVFDPVTAIIGQITYTIPAGIVLTHVASGDTFLPINWGISGGLVSMGFTPGAP